jgi:hypothetical protein
MSHVATNWAFQQRGIKPGPKVVLLHLADCHNPSYGGAFPSQDYLAEQCEIPRSTLNVYLNELQESGLIAREQRKKTGSKKQDSTRYYFPFEADFSQFATSKPSPESGHGSEETESRNQPKPCPENGQNRVQNLDTNLVREPVTESVSERERESERNFGKNKIGVVDAELIKQVQRFCKGEGYTAGEWKGWSGATIGHIAKHFAALSMEDREKACQGRDAFLAKCKRDNGGAVMRVSYYFRDRVWEMLTPAETAPATATPQVVTMFSKAWMGKRFATLLRPASRVMPVAPVYQQRVLAAGGAEADKIKLDRLKLYGWPALDQIDKPGRCVVSDAITAAAAGFESVEPDSELWQAWKALHDRNGWRWLPPSGDHKWFFFPAIDAGAHDLNIAVADALAKFAAQLSEANDDAA